MSDQLVSDYLQAKKDRRSASDRITNLSGLVGSMSALLHSITVTFNFMQPSPKDPAKLPSKAELVKQYQNWPKAEELIEAVEAYRESCANVVLAWSKIPNDMRSQLVPPDRH